MDVWKQLLNRMMRAARLDNILYEEMETEREASGQAIMIALLVSAAAGLGMGITGIIGMKGPLWFLWGLLSGFFVALAGWLVKKIVTQESIGNLFPHTILNLPILFYLIISLASGVFGTNPEISLRHFIFKTLKYLFLFMVIVETLDRRVLRNIFIALVLSVVFVGIDGIWCYFAPDNG